MNTISRMLSGFYLSVPRSVNGGSSNPLLERKLDEILLGIRLQNNCMLSLEEKGMKTLKSVENLGARMSVLEDKMEFTEQMILVARLEKRNEKSRIPPDLSIIVIL